MQHPFRRPLLAAAAAAALLMGPALAQIPAAQAPAPTAQAADPVQAALAESRAAAQALTRDLLTAVKSSLAADGPVGAIRTCNEVAPGIADALSQGGMTVGRTSLKVRNPDNAPDGWERAVLEDFAGRKAAGADPATLEHWEVLPGAEGGRSFRYMKAIAIPAESPCLTCHGTDLAPAVVAALDQLYPADQARGYRAGDLRGAVTVTRPLP
ncbi:Tll0287-like domain-containing protein [Rhodospirillum centenum]|uniref:Cytochrome c fa n=1 Tax=Rhodospirillum centenum (strain ATCC 51521 / SW) TaxID=414684 RepID=B6IUL1_RHOCS|nr:DUF3365 domain-containing protein [Rhodospirillum centenum]ACI99836.1 cytochrome c fa [Rhodospirillum centenum SW]